LRPVAACLRPGRPRRHQDSPAPRAAHFLSRWPSWNDRSVRSREHWCHAAQDQNALGRLPQDLERRRHMRLS
jgi:hypothetical protein